MDDSCIMSFCMFAHLDVHRGFDTLALAHDVLPVELHHGFVAGRKTIGSKQEILILADDSMFRAWLLTCRLRHRCGFYVDGTGGLVRLAPTQHRPVQVCAQSYLLSSLSPLLLLPLVGGTQKAHAA